MENKEKTKTKTKTWLEYMPEKVELYYVDGENFNHQTKQLQKCLMDNNLYGIEDVTNAWYAPEQETMDEIHVAMQEDDMEEEYRNHIDDIMNYLYEHDESDPVKEMLDNTDFHAFYSLGVELDGWHEAFMCQPWCNETDAQKAYKIRRALGITKNSPEVKKILELVQNSPSGGELRIYFDVEDLRDFISGHPYDDSESKADFKAIKFDGNCMVAVYNAAQGSGDFQEIQLDNLEIAFRRENLYVAGSDKYGIEDTFGLCGNWLECVESPSLSMTLNKSAKTVKKSANADKMKEEARLDKIFAEGGCTAGDKDMNRHHDVQYINEIPCRWRCPHCGTEWLD